MREILVLSRFLIIFISLAATCCLVAAPKIQEDTPVWLKLSDKTPIISLQDDWEFYWKKLIGPQDSLPEPSAKIRTGQEWKGLQLQSGEVLQVYGYATYRKVLRGLPPQPRGYQIGLESAGQAFNLIVFPSDRPQFAQVINNGRVDPERSQGSRRYAIINIRPEKVEDYTILLQVSNSNYGYGGAYYPIKIALGNEINRSFEIEGLVNLVGIGITIGVGIYCLMMWIRRREDRPALMLAITSLVALFRTLTSVPYLVNLFPDFFYSVILRLTYSSMPLGCVAYLHFLLATCRPNSHLLLMRFSSWLPIGLGVFSFLAPIAWITSLLPLYHLAILLLLVSYLLIIRASLRQKQPGLGLVMVGCLIICCGFITDILVSTFASTSLYVTPLAVMVFLILQGQLVALRAAHVYTRSEQLSQELSERNAEITFFNKNLERLIEQKTRDIRSLLDHIPQGVFSVGPQALVAPDYSHHLTGILEFDDIAKVPFTQVLLNRVLLDADRKDQITQSILASIDDDEISFELNSDHLPKEFIYQIHDRKKYLRATWSHVLNEDHKVARILVTLLDVSQEKELEEDARHNKEQMHIIQELLDVSAEVARQFFATAWPLLKENLAKLELNTFDPASVRLMFVNAHTIKGSARTLKFRALAAAIHEAEDHFSAILRGVTAQPDLIKAAWQKVFAIFQEYLDINNDKLNRRKQSASIAVSRKLLMEYYLKIVNMQAKKAIEPRQTEAFLQNLKASVTSLLFEQTAQIFGNYRDLVKKMAIDLGKDLPQFDIDVPDINMSSEARIVLDNAMIHILRNAIDHGFESAAERLKKDKPSHGLLQLTGTLRDNRLVIRLTDDGRGLAISHLRMRGLEQGYLKANSSLEEVASSIFRTGVTTARTVSELSGRGIGLDAAQAFLRNIGGDLSIELGPEHRQDRGYYPFTIILSVPCMVPNEVPAAA